MMASVFGEMLQQLRFRLAKEENNRLRQDDSISSDHEYGKDTEQSERIMAEFKRLTFGSLLALEGFIAH